MAALKAMGTGPKEKRDSEDPKKEGLLAVLRETTGSLSVDDYPHWATPEKVAAWFGELRQGNPLPDGGDEFEEH